MLHSAGPPWRIMNLIRSPGSYNDWSLMQRQIFHISFNVRTNWALLLVGRLNKATNPALKARYERLWKSELYPIALSLEAKLSKLPSVVRVVDQAIGELSKEFEDRTAEIDDVSPTIRARSFFTIPRRSHGIG